VSAHADDRRAERPGPGTAVLLHPVSGALDAGPRHVDRTAPVERISPDRGRVLPELVDPDGLDAVAAAVRWEVMASLPELLERFADAALARGAHIYWASTALEARSYVVRVVQAHDAERVVRSRSTVIDEIELRAALEARGAAMVEGWDGALIPEVGITGVDVAVAETGSIVVVTEEGNGRLVASLSRTHVAVLGIDRLVRSWQQAEVVLRLLSRSADGHDRSSSTTVVTGARDPDELDGPEELHIVVLDDGRSSVLGGRPPEVPGCIHCGAAPDGRDLGMGPGNRMGLSPADDAGSGFDERAAWQLWAAAWSDASRYEATTRAVTWGRLATGTAGHLPLATSWTAGRTVPQRTAERFRDRWRKGLV
jgi:L-lactate utilization protein LutC